VQEDPYLIDRGSHIEGNARFEGYIADLLERLSTKAGFKYTIKLVADKKYGRRLENGRWNGMIREVMESVSIIKVVLIYVILCHVLRFLVYIEIII